MARNKQHSWISLKASSGGIEWASAFFNGLAFSPHRHDTYAIGYTTAGVQSFNYRGKERFSCAGDVFILHPDELHDGRQGTDEGYGYRIVYLAPHLISNALGGSALPFFADAVTKDPRLAQVIAGLFPDPDETEDDLYRTGAISALADAMKKLAGQSYIAHPRTDVSRMRSVQEHLIEHIPAAISISDLEQEHGMDRYVLSRQFRRFFGVSPHRFVTMRRLGIAMSKIRQGQSLAQAAMAAGFADQSHMTRHFRKAFGLSPGTWRRLLRR